MMRMARLLPALILLGLLAAAAVAAQRDAAGPRREWRLAFVRGTDIWIARGDGTDQRLIVKDGRAPAWSHDRKWIAFVRDRSIWIAKADGSGQRRISPQWAKTCSWEGGGQCHWATADSGRLVDISWHPAGKEVAFSHPEPFHLSREGGKESTEVPATSISTTLITGEAEPAVQWDMTDVGAAFSFSGNEHPAWAGDGKRLAFTRNGDIWLATWVPETASMRSGWDVQRLAAVASYDAPTHRVSRENDAVTHLSWAPDGRTLAYDYQRLHGSGTEETYLLDVATGKRRRLTQYGIDPCFSPDGRFIAYTAIGPYPQHAGIWAISRDGKTDRPLIKDGEQPAW